MNFLKFASKHINLLSNIYQAEDLFKIDKFHLDNIELGRNFLSFKMYLPMPKKEEDKWKKDKNIATLKITIIIDGKLIIKKNCTNENSHKGLEFFNIEIEELDNQYYKINLISNDGTHIYTESSSISGIFRLEMVEDWFIKEVCPTTPPA
jgi:hypothetical protein